MGPGHSSRSLSPAQPLTPEDRNSSAPSTSLSTRPEPVVRQKVKRSPRSFWLWDDRPRQARLPPHAEAGPRAGDVPISHPVLHDLDRDIRLGRKRVPLVTHSASATSEVPTGHHSESIRRRQPTPHTRPGSTDDGPSLSLDQSPSRRQERVAQRRHLPYHLLTAKNHHLHHLPPSNSSPAGDHLRYWSNEHGGPANIHDPGTAQDAVHPVGRRSVMFVDTLPQFVDPVPHVRIAASDHMPGALHGQLQDEEPGRIERRSSPTTEWSPLSETCLPSRKETDACPRSETKLGYDYGTCPASASDDLNMFHGHWWRTCKGDALPSTRPANFPKSSYVPDITNGGQLGSVDALESSLHLHDTFNPSSSLYDFDHLSSSVVSSTFSPRSHKADRTVHASTYLPRIGGSSASLLDTTQGSCNALNTLDRKPTIVEERFLRELDRKLHWLSYEFSSGLHESADPFRIGPSSRPTSHGITFGRALPALGIGSAYDRHEPEIAMERTEAWRLAVNEFRENVVPHLDVHPLNPILHLDETADGGAEGQSNTAVPCVKRSSEDVQPLKVRRKTRARGPRPRTSKISDDNRWKWLH
ncbi:MAG: hypothetical protein M1837_004018 [Sclerophora amabilis]|nr:MAG: hypothetical protein M1837_004018 [Sclerophora amabilis]